VADVTLRIIGKDEASQQIARVNKELAQIDKTAGAAGGGGLARLKSGLTDALAVASRMAIGIGAVGATLKKAFNLGREIAALDFTRQKMDNLAASIGTTSDALLTDLRSATRGMVSDAQLVTSATDFMTLGLANTHDEVVRLSRVAGALGMNMNQLVLTLTNQTTMRFDALGVSVAGFDERLQGLIASGMDANEAFTEAFLQQAEEQITKVGEAADSAVAPFDKLAVAVTNQANEFKTKLLPVLTKAATTLELLITWNDQLRASFDKHKIDVLETSQTYEDYVREVLRAADAAGVLSMRKAAMLEDVYLENATVGLEREQYIALAESIGLANKFVFEFNRLTGLSIVVQEDLIEQLSRGQMQDYAEMAGLASGEVGKLGAEARESEGDIEELGNTIQEAAGKFTPAKKAIADLAGAWEKARKRADEYFGAIDRGISSQIEGRLKDLEFMAAGGGNIQAALDEIDKAIGYGLDPQAAAQFFGPLYIESQELEVALGNITADEAAQNIANTLNVSLDAAQQLMDGLVSTSAILDGLRIQMEINVRLTGPGAALLAEGIPSGGGGGGSGGTGTVQPPTVPTPPGGGVPYYQFGGPVASGQAYLVGESGPELFVPSSHGQVVSNNDMRSGMWGGVRIDNLSIQAGGGQDGRTIADDFLSQVNALIRRRSAAGMEYAGL
jgi:hypothetical protein